MGVLEVELPLVARPIARRAGARGSEAELDGRVEDAAAVCEAAKQREEVAAYYIDTNVSLLGNRQLFGFY